MCNRLLLPLCYLHDSFVQLNKAISACLKAGKSSNYQFICILCCGSLIVYPGFLPDGVLGIMGGCWELIDIPPPSQPWIRLRKAVEVLHRFPTRVLLLLLVLATTERPPLFLTCLKPQDQRQCSRGGGLSVTAVMVSGRGGRES